MIMNNGPLPLSRVIGLMHAMRERKKRTRAMIAGNKRLLIVVPGKNAAKENISRDISFNPAGIR